MSSRYFCDPINVVFVHRRCPHYRLPVFQALSKSKKITCSIAYGQSISTDSLQSVKPEGIHHVPLNNRWIGSAGKWVWQSKALQLALDNKIDVFVLEASPYVLSNVLLCIMAYIKQRPILLWGHGIGRKNNLFTRMLRVIIPNLLGGYIFYDDIRAQKVVSWGLPANKTFVARNTIDTCEIERLRRSWDIYERRSILYIGRLIPEKRLDLLLSAFSIACNTLPIDTNLMIIGDGPLRANLERKANQLGIRDRVMFYGQITHQTALAPLFNSAWISVCPGYAGLNIVHSLAYGVPLLVADSEHHSPEIIVMHEGETGFYFKSCDSQHLAEKMVYIWNH